MSPAGNLLVYLIYPCKIWFSFFHYYIVWYIALIGNSDENSLIHEMEQLTTDEQSQSQADDERDEIVIRIQDDSSSAKGICI